jgi:hypothetical protein
MIDAMRCLPEIRLTTNPLPGDILDPLYELFLTRGMLERIRSDNGLIGIMSL